MHMELLASESFHYHSRDIETLKIHYLSQFVPFQESMTAYETYSKLGQYRFSEAAQEYH
jgi:hypothetical protein